MKNEVAQHPIDRGTRVRVACLATVPAMLAGVIGAILIASWRDRLPNPVATHWSVHGANGFAGQTTVLIIPLVIAVVAAVIGAVLVRGASDPTLARTVVGIVTAVAISTIAIAVWSVAVQRGVTDASGVPTPAWPVVGSVIAGLICGSVCAALVPWWETSSRAGVGTLPQADLGAGERFLWTRTVSTSPVASVLIGVAIVLVAALVFFTRMWPLVVVLVILVVPTVLMWSIRVTVDRSGVTLRGGLGWPRIHLSAASIDHAEVREIRALGDFGGYGYRISVRGDLKGAKGFVLRSGPALLIRRTDGRRDVVVVDDAQTAAGLINHVAGRGGSAGGRPAESAR